MKVYLFPGGQPYDGPEGIPVTGDEMPFTWIRPLAVATVAILAAALHGLALLWYLNRPAPLPVSEAAPLPMIDLALSAPPSPAAVQPVATPPPVPPKAAKKPEPKPVKKPKPKPKPVRQESPVKQVEIQKEEPDTAPPAPSAPPARIQDRTAAPRNAVYTPASSDANYLNNPKPVYPSVARSRHWEGLVVLRATLG
jgi:protein TonB